MYLPDDGPFNIFLCEMGQWTLSLMITTVINQPERGGIHRSVCGYVILRWVTIDILFLYIWLLDHTAARPLGSCARPQLLGHGPWSLVDCSAITLDHGLQAVCILFGLLAQPSTMVPSLKFTHSSI